MVLQPDPYNKWQIGRTILYFFLLFQTKIYDEIVLSIEANAKNASKSRFVLRF